MFSQVRQVRLYETVVNDVINKINTRHLQPGDRLPGERELAESFGVSRVVIREAVKTLKTMGLVEVVHGRGIFVVDPLDKLEALPYISSDLKNNDMQDIWEFRQIMEPRVAEIVAVRATNEDLGRIIRIHQDMTAAIEGGSQGITEAIDFHKALVLSTKNRAIIIAFKTLDSLINHSIKKVFIDEVSSKDALNQHERILNAILARDALEAFSAMENHLDSMANTFYSEMASN